MVRGQAGLPRLIRYEHWKYLDKAFRLRGMHRRGFFCLTTAVTAHIRSGRPLSLGSRVKCGSHEVSSARGPPGRNIAELRAPLPLPPLPLALYVP